jgi:3-oxoacyl-[acyl-carrier protein] reductase
MDKYANEIQPIHNPVQVGDAIVETWGMRRFEGRVVAVTGAASGMGEAVVQRFLAEGAIVYALDLSQEKLDGLWGQIDGVTSIAVDVADSASVNAAFERIRLEHGGLHSLVTAAGVSDSPTRMDPDGGHSSADPTTIDDDSWNFVIGINLTGTFFCVRAALPLIRATGDGGAIVTISSVGAFAPYPLPAAYPASKAGVTGMTRAIAALVGKENIRINSVAPAATRTPMLPTDEALLDSLLALQPIPRAIPASEMAASIVYLCSDEAQFMTGQTVHINGGMVM